MRLKPGGSAPRGGKGASLWVEGVTWDTLSWIEANTTLPIVLKGIQVRRLSRRLPLRV